MKQRKIFSQWIIIALIAALALERLRGSARGHGHACSCSEFTKRIIACHQCQRRSRARAVDDVEFAQAGNVDELLVKEGDAIKAGDVIARLSAPELQANLAQKQAAVKVAEASLAQLTAPAREEDIRAAQEAVNSAQASVAEATAQRDLLYSAVTQADILQAETQVYAIQTQKDKLDEAMRKS